MPQGTTLRLQITFIYVFLVGVDDMFVILACWNELTAEQKKLPIHERIGLMLKHAGVSITITSFTDVIAFLIGASTVRVLGNVILISNLLFSRSCHALSPSASMQQQEYL